MSLRGRLVVALVLAAAPMVVTMTWARGLLDRHAEVESTRRFIVDRTEAGGTVFETEESPWLSRSQWMTALTLTMSFTLAAFITAGPLVARVRRLTREVHASARDRYVTPVTVTGNDEITLLAREFNEARDEVRRQFKAVEARERALRSFVANTMHDVMIPITVLKGHLSRLRDAESTPDPAVLHHAMEEVHYTASLLRNLSASARLQAGEQALVCSSVDLGALVERVIARHAPIGQQKGIELNVGLPEGALVGQADPTLLEQAVSNLVHNAVRHGHRGGHVAVLLDQPPGCFWRLRVVDDGPGIAADVLESLMQRPTAADEARPRQAEGEGLGLRIVQEVARRHEFTWTLKRSEYGGLEAEIEATERSGHALSVI